MTSLAQALSGPLVCYGLTVSEDRLSVVPVPLQSSGLGLTLAYNNSIKPNLLRKSAYFGR